MSSKSLLRGSLKAALAVACVFALSLAGSRSVRAQARTTLQSLQNQVDSILGRVGGVEDEIVATQSEIEMIRNGSTPVGSVKFVTGMAPDGADNGYIIGRQLIFTKAQGSTLLKVTYSDSLRVTGPGVKSWSVELDGVDIGPIATVVHFGRNDSDTHQTTTGVLYISSPVSAGRHIIQIKVGPPVGFSPSASGDALTGAYGKFLLEVQEIPSI